MASNTRGGAGRSRTAASVETALLAVVLSAVLPPRRGKAGDAGKSATPEERAAGKLVSPTTNKSPADIPPKGWWQVARRVYDEIGNDRILAVAAGVTFYGLLAVFPAVAAFVSIFGLVADPATINDNLASLAGVMPDGALAIVGDQVKRVSESGSALGVALITGLGVSLWSANAGMKAVFDALNVAYGVPERRNFVVLNLWSLAFTGAMILFLVIALSGVVVIPVVLKFVGLGAVTELLISLARWPALAVIVLLGLAFLYRFGPSRQHVRWRWVSAGSLLAGLGWIVFSMLFSWYVSRFGNYNATYGSLGAAIGFLTWMWLSATIVLVGAEVNAEVEDQARAM